MSFETPAHLSIFSLRYPELSTSQPKEEALQYLRRISGLDFGDDPVAWENWAKENGKWDFPDCIRESEIEQQKRKYRLASLPSRNVAYEAVTADDFEELLTIRILAMRDSLERIGRFDPQRARERLRNSFFPEYTQFIVYDKERIGFCTFRAAEEGFHLDHFYLKPQFQSRGIGSGVLRHLLARAHVLRKPVYVTALRDSEANRFYLRHGFVQTHEEEWDIHYFYE
jgi:GNAT superfamily N-acetyltransferase